MNTFLLHTHISISEFIFFQQPIGGPSINTEAGNVKSYFMRYVDLIELCIPAANNAEPVFVLFNSFYSIEESK